MKTTTRILAALLVGLLAPSAGAIPLSQWSKTASSNNATVPDGAPENWTGSQVNDWGRQTMKVVRDWYDDPQWLEISYDLTTRGAKTLTKIDADTIDLDLADATAYFTAGRRIQIVGASTVSCYVVSSSLNAGDTRIEVGTSCTVPNAPTAIYAYFGKDLRSGGFVSAGETTEGYKIQRGELQARISYTSASQVTIGRGYNQKLRAEIDGVIVESSSDLTVDISTADREDTSACGGSASEVASTWYYLYLDEASGVPVEHISSTAPVMDPASGKVGYHPGTCSGSTGWRAIGAIFNNSSSDIQPFYVNADGWWLFRTTPTASPFTQTLGDPSALTSYTSLAFTNGFPQTARVGRFHVFQKGDANAQSLMIAHEAVTGTIAATRGMVEVEVGAAGGTARETAANEIFDLPIDSTPTLKYGVEGAYSDFTTLRFRVVGWRDDFGISY